MEERITENEQRKKLKKRIYEKIEELEKYLIEFSELNIPDIEEYKKNIRLKACCERYFEKIIEPIISIGTLTIRLIKADSPETEDHIFFILAKNKIISEELAKRLRDAKDMRNIIIHDYFRVDDSIVYYALTEELEKDTHDFLNSIKKLN